MRKNLYLFVAVACFVALVAILILDGYLGVFDTLRVMTGSGEFTLTTDDLMRPVSLSNYNYDPRRQLNAGGNTTFEYELENRQYTVYETHFEATVWGQNEPGPLAVSSQDVRIEPFKSSIIRWTVNGAALSAKGYTGGLLTLRIKRGDVERDVPLDYLALPPKAIPAVPAPTTSP